MATPKLGKNTVYEFFEFYKRELIKLGAECFCKVEGSDEVIPYSEWQYKGPAGKYSGGLYVIGQEVSDDGNLILKVQEPFYPTEKDLNVLLKNSKWVPKTGCIYGYLDNKPSCISSSNAFEAFYVVFKDELCNELIATAIYNPNGIKPMNLAYDEMTKPLTLVVFGEDFENPMAFDDLSTARRYMESMKGILFDKHVSRSDFKMVMEPYLF